MLQQIIRFPECLELVFQFIISLGVVLAYIEYRRKHNWEKKKGLKLELTIQKKQDENLILFKTSVVNKTNKTIIISSACIQFSNHITGEIEYKFPLNYFDSENIQVGNEILRYVFPLELSDYKATDKIWDVTFKVVTETGLYRIVHSSFKGTFIKIKD